MGYVDKFSGVLNLVCRLSYVNWMWYAWGAVMITIFAGTEAIATNGQPILEYYSLAPDLLWAFVGYRCASLARGRLRLQKAIYTLLPMHLSHSCAACKKLLSADLSRAVGCMHPVIVQLAPWC